MKEAGVNLPGCLEDTHCLFEALLVVRKEQLLLAVDVMTNAMKTICGALKICAVGTLDEFTPQSPFSNESGTSTSRVVFLLDSFLTKICMPARKRKARCKVLDALLVVNLGLDVTDGVTGLQIQSDCRAGQRTHPHPQISACHLLRWPA